MIDPNKNKNIGVKVTSSVHLPARSDLNRDNMGGTSSGQHGVTVGKLALQVEGSRLFSSCCPSCLHIVHKLYLNNDCLKLLQPSEFIFSLHGLQVHPGELGPGPLGAQHPDRLPRRHRRPGGKRVEAFPP